MTLSEKDFQKNLDVILQDGRSPEDLGRLVSDWVKVIGGGQLQSQFGRIEGTYNFEFGPNGRYEFVVSDVSDAVLGVFDMHGNVVESSTSVETTVADEGDESESGYVSVTKIETEPIPSAREPEPEETELPVSTEGYLLDLEQRFEAVLRDTSAPEILMTEIAQLIPEFIKFRISRLVLDHGTVFCRKNGSGRRITVRQAVNEAVSEVGVFDEEGNPISKKAESSSKSPEKNDARAITKKKRGSKKSSATKKDAEELPVEIPGFPLRRIGNKSVLKHEDVQKLKDMPSEDRMLLIGTFRSDTQSDVKIALKKYEELGYVPVASNFCESVEIKASTLRKLEKRIREYLDDQSLFWEKYEDTVTPVSTTTASYLNKERIEEQDINEFVIIFQERLIYYALRFTYGVRSDAEEIVQDALMKVARRLTIGGKIIHGRGLKAYVYTAIDNKAIDWARKKERRKEESYDGFGDEDSSDWLGSFDPGDRNSPADLADSSEMCQNILTMMEKAMTKQQFAVVKCKLRGLSYVEIKDACNISSASNVGFILNTAKNRFKEYLQRQRREMERELEKNRG